MLGVAIAIVVIVKIPHLCQQMLLTLLQIKGF